MTAQAEVLRINYAPVSVRVCSGSKGNSRQRFRCWLDDGSPVGPESGLCSPAYDGARALIASGVSPDRLMTTRSALASCDSWSPAAVAFFARLCVADSPSGVKVSRWRPFSAGAVCEKQGKSVLPATSAPASGDVPPDPTPPRCADIRHLRLKCGRLAWPVAQANGVSERVLIARLKSMSPDYAVRGFEVS